MGSFSMFGSLKWAREGVCKALMFLTVGKKRQKEGAEEKKLAVYAATSICLPRHE